MTTTAATCFTSSYLKPELVAQGREFLFKVYKQRDVRNALANFNQYRETFLQDIQHCMATRGHYDPNSHTMKRSSKTTLNYNFSEEDIARQKSITIDYLTEGLRSKLGGWCADKELPAILAFFAYKIEKDPLNLTALKKLNTKLSSQKMISFADKVQKHGPSSKPAVIETVQAPVDPLAAFEKKRALNFLTKIRGDLVAKASDMQELRKLKQRTAALDQAIRTLPKEDVSARRQLLIFLKDDDFTKLFGVLPDLLAKKTQLPQLLRTLILLVDSIRTYDTLIAHKLGKNSIQELLQKLNKDHSFLKDVVFTPYLLKAKTPLEMQSSPRLVFLPLPPLPSFEDKPTKPAGDVPKEPADAVQLDLPKPPTEDASEKPAAAPSKKPKRTVIFVDVPESPRPAAETPPAEPVKPASPASAAAAPIEPAKLESSAAEPVKPASPATAATTQTEPPAQQPAAASSPKVELPAPQLPPPSLPKIEATASVPPSKPINVPQPTIQQLPVAKPVIPLSQRRIVQKSCCKRTFEALCRTIRNIFCCLFCCRKPKKS